MELVLAPLPGVLPAGQRARGDAGLLLQGVRGLAGQRGAAHLVAGLAVGIGDRRRGGRLAGAGAADDERQVVAGGGVDDGGALLGGELRHPLERALDQAGIEPQVLPAGEL